MLVAQVGLLFVGGSLIISLPIYTQSNMQTMLYVLRSPSCIVLDDGFQQLDARIPGTAKTNQPGYHHTCVYTKTAPALTGSPRQAHAMCRKRSQAHSFGVRPGLSSNHGWDVKATIMATRIHNQAFKIDMTCWMRKPR